MANFLRVLELDWRCTCRTVLMFCELKCQHDSSRQYVAWHLIAGVWARTVRGVSAGLHEADWHPASYSNQVCPSTMAISGAKCS